MQLVLRLWRRKPALAVWCFPYAGYGVAVPRSPLTLFGSTLEPSRSHARQLFRGTLLSASSLALVILIRMTSLLIVRSRTLLYEILTMDGRSNTSGATGGVPRSLTRVHPRFESSQPVLPQQVIEFGALTDPPRRQISESAKTGPHGSYQIREFPLLGHDLSRTLLPTRQYVQSMNIPFDPLTYRISGREAAFRASQRLRVIERRRDSGRCRALEGAFAPDCLILNPPRACGFEIYWPTLGMSTAWTSALTLSLI